MRFVLPLVALCALSSPSLRASDIFNITLTPGPGSVLSGSGTFTTDGICVICVPGEGLLSVTINIGPDSGPDAFDIRDDLLPIVSLYQRPTNTLAYGGVNSETSDILDTELHIWILTTQAGSPLGTGTYTVTPAVPEPSSLVLLMPIVTIVGLRWRHQRHRA